MTNVIKVNHIIGENVKTVYIFAGKIKINPEYPWNLQDDDSSPVFNDEELKVITDLKPDVIIVRGYLHSDDTISTVKNKIIKYTNIPSSTAELYLFGIIETHINPAILYDRLTQMDTIKLTKDGICQMLLNIIDNGCEKTNTNSVCDLLDSDKDSFGYEDFLSIDNIEWGSPVDYTIPIGQKIIKKKQYPFIANPYNCNVVDRVLSKDVEQLVTTEKSNLLFEYGKLCNNTIYACFAEDVLQHTDNKAFKIYQNKPEVVETIKGDNAELNAKEITELLSKQWNLLSEEDKAPHKALPGNYLLNIYFPVLVSLYGVKTLAELKIKKRKLYEDQEKLLNEAFDIYNERVDLLYDVFYNKTSHINYDDSSPGITKLKFIIHPTQTMNIPLELIFKLLHSTIEVPMVKYNPGGGHDNVYRFYTDAIAKNGKKIPYLYTKNKNTRSKIIYISKRIAKKKRVAYYLEYTFNDTNYLIDCEFESNGNVIVTLLLDKINNIQQIEDVIKLSINPPLLDKIKVYLEQSGYTYKTFDALNSPNIEIIEFTYSSVLKLRKKIQLEPFLSCLSTIFTTDKTQIVDQNNQINMKYKRVSNYNKFDAIETLINDMRKNNSSKEEIIQKLIINFTLDKNEAIDYYAKWARQINIATDLFENKKITIRTNTGFPVSIIQNMTNFKTTFQISLVNDINYIDKFFVYIDSLIRFILDDGSTTIESKTIMETCAGVEQLPDVIVEDLTNHKINVRKTEAELDLFLDLIAQTENSVGEDSVDEDAEDSVDEDSVDEDSETKSMGKTEIQDIQMGLLLDSSSEDDDEYDMEDDDFNLDDIEIGVAPTQDKVDDEFGDMDFAALNDLTTTLSIENLTKEKSIPREQEEKSVPKEQEGESKDDIKVDLTGVTVRGHGNIFINRKEELQPGLFLKTDTAGYNSYSKSCPSQYAKQPMLLTTAEKGYIDAKDNKSGTKSYDEHVTYGTGDEKYHYICPRFWCLSDEEGESRSLSLEEINKGTCGGWDALVPPNTTTVPAGKRILEFTDTRFHKVDTVTDNLMVYKPMFPSFQPSEKHPDGLCVPCCFTRASTSGWAKETIDEKTKKPGYYNEKLKKHTVKYPTEDMVYDDMYAPTGESKHGPGPEYDLDEKGNIDMSSVKGNKTKRDKPTRAREKIYNKCNQSDDDKQVEDEDIMVNISENPLLDAWPLNIGQTGYLSYPLQRFLGYNCREICQKSLSNTQLKLNQQCLLHKGVERHDTQSFISCMADWYGVANNNALDNLNKSLYNDVSPTIEQIKRTILKKITIDNFILLQGGSLVDTFYKEDVDLDFDLFIDTALYNSLLINDGEETKGKNKLSYESNLYFKRVISAFVTFGKYIENNDTTIDYTYLWDLISLPAELGGLFENGLNMIIINSPRDDITSKIQVICPTNAYNNNIYDVKRKTILIFSQNGYFEPIYKYTRINKKEYNIQKLFDFNTIKKELPEVGGILTYIWHDIQTKCKPLPSIDVFNSMQFKESISFEDIVKILEKHTTYKVVKQIVNFNSIVIGGLFLNAPGGEIYIYIPCRPSAINITIPYTFVHDSALLNTSVDTISNLKYIHNITNGKIPCKPMLKIVTDGIIIGIVTETNQMIAVQPESYQEDPPGVETDIKVVETNNVAKDYNTLDRTFLTDKSKDVKRMKKIKEIKIESKFYNIFRNLLRITFSHTEYKEIVENIQQIIKSPIELFHDKLRRINGIVKTVMAKYITFVEYNIDSIDSVLNIEQCINLDNDKCEENTMCVISAEEADPVDNICKILLPKTNLINGRNNEVEYFTRIVNELINYPRIRTFILNSSKFLSFRETSYNLRDDEIILLEGLLYEGYFEDIVVDKKNNYVGDKTNWITAKPSKSLPFENNFTISYKFKARNVNDCIVTVKKDMKLINGNFNELGFGEYDIVEYKDDFYCSWQLMSDVISLHIKQDITIDDVLETLVDKYEELSKGIIDSTQRVTFKDVLVTMNMEGKKDQVAGIKNGTSIKDIITHSNYYLTPIDFCIIAHIYNIPIIVVCRTQIPYLKKKHISFINTNAYESCYIIASGNYSKANSKISPVYGLFTKHDSPKLLIDQLGERFNELVDAPHDTLVDYILFSKGAYKKPVKRLAKRMNKTYKNNPGEEKTPIKKGAPVIIKKAKRIKINATN
tara:strand:- start:16576 stop:23028 length:6453 start_codon:yes stop_codon:yes gene_type:complete